MNGLILWWDNRDGCGVAVGDDKLEYYIDSSAVPKGALAHLCSGLPIVFTQNTSIEHTRCARVEWVNLQHALGSYQATLTKLRAMDPSHLRPEAISELEAKAKDIEDQFKEEDEACTHDDDFECGHCIDCGEYVPYSER